MTDDSSPGNKVSAVTPIFAKWTAGRSLLLLTLATLACLLPFRDKAFHIDDPLFVWTAQHIAEHPADPYGFRVVWYQTETPIADVTKNPPLAGYYAALAGAQFGWTERTLHLAFFLPALAVVLGTYRLARRFTKDPVVAAAVTLFAPGFLVSSTTVMCDVLMLAWWMWAVVLWVEGLDSDRGGKHRRLAAASLMMAACALTKYFGVMLIPLLLVYTMLRLRRISVVCGWLAVPVVLLAQYQLWTAKLYGRGLLSDAVQYASLHNRGHELSPLAKALAGLAFLGGCALPVLFLSPMLWRRRWIFAGAALCGLTGLAVSGHPAWFAAPLASGHWPLISAELAVFLAGGVSALGLAGASEFRKTVGGGDPPWNPDAVLLVLWSTGTFLFAAFVNWTVNARSILPMIPAVAILLTRQLEGASFFSKPGSAIKTAMALASSAAVSLWVAWADANLANAGREAANQIYAQVRSAGAPVYFEGHWGFQFYLQNLGAKPADIRNTPFRENDIVVIPENTTNSFGPPAGFALSGRLFEFEVRGQVATMSQPLGAGFYASLWGPLPFVVGRAPRERYYVARLVPASPEQPATIGQ